MYGMSRRNERRRRRRIMTTKVIKNKHAEQTAEYYNWVKHLQQLSNERR